VLLILVLLTDLMGEFSVLLCAENWSARFKYCHFNF